MKTSKSIQFSRFNTSPTAPPPPPQIKKLAVAPSDVQSNKSAHFEQIVEKTPAPCLEYFIGYGFLYYFWDGATLLLSAVLDYLRLDTLP